MDKYQYIVTVEAASQEEAEEVTQIMMERINHDEDLREYGIGDCHITFGPLSNQKEDA